MKNNSFNPMLLAAGKLAVSARKVIESSSKEMSKHIKEMEIALDAYDELMINSTINTKDMEYVNKNAELDNTDKKLHIFDVNCRVCKSCEREICPICDSRLIKYKVVDNNGKSLDRNSYICTLCGFISDLDIKNNTL